MLVAFGGLVISQLDTGSVRQINKMNRVPHLRRIFNSSPVLEGRGTPFPGATPPAFGSVTLPLQCGLSCRNHGKSNVKPDASWEVELPPDASRFSLSFLQNQLVCPDCVAIGFKGVEIDATGNGTPFVVLAVPLGRSILLNIVTCGLLS